MPYSGIRDGLLTLLRSIEGFDADNVRYADWEPLNKGKSRVLVLTYAGFGREANAFRGEEWRDWRFTLALFTAFTSIPESRAAEDIDREHIIETLWSYPLLNATADVFDCWINSAQPLPEPQELGGGKWLMETFDITVREDVSGPTQEG